MYNKFQITLEQLLESFCYILNENNFYHFFSVSAAFGGTASLFLGFSFLSAIEFIYYFTVRQFVAWMRVTFVCISKKKKKKTVRKFQM